MPDYRNMDDKHPIFVEGFYRQAKGATIKNTHLKGTKLKYSEYDAGINYTYTLNPEHFLNLALGTYGENLNWNANPAFLGKNYDYVVGSIGFTSLGIENWRWSSATVLSFQTQNFGIKESGYISIMFWGEYFATNHFHVHAGFWGYTGVKNIYFLPILGFNWNYKEYEVAAIFPFDIAIRYKPFKAFHMELAGKWLGGPYRFPQRMNNGIKEFKNGIFELFAPTTELGLYYHPSYHLNIGVSGGYTYGGWLLVRNSKNKDTIYYKFKSAPYAAVSGMFKF